MGKWQVDADQRTAKTNLGPHGEWVAEVRWPEGQTQGGPTELVIRPSAPGTYPPGGLSQTVLRDVDFKDALLGLQLVAHAEPFRQESAETVLDLLRGQAASGAITSDYLAALSWAYVVAVSRGQSKPLDYLAEETGKSPAAIKNHLWQATRKGLLERSPGRAGGKLTDEAWSVLASLDPPE